jgi:hypothetical protein
MAMTFLVIEMAEICQSNEAETCLIAESKWFSEVAARLH